MPLWKQFLTACLLAFSSMLFSCDALVGSTMGVTSMPVTTGDTIITSQPLSSQPTEALGAPAVMIDSIIPASSCTELMGDIQVVEPPVIQGFTIIEPVPDTQAVEVLPPPLPVEQPDTSYSEPMIVGKIAFHPIDTTAVKTDSSICDSDFIKL